MIRRQVTGSASVFDDASCCTEDSGQSIQPVPLSNASRV